MEKLGVDLGLAEKINLENPRRHNRHRDPRSAQQEGGSQRAGLSRGHISYCALATDRLTQRASAPHAARSPEF